LAGGLNKALLCGMRSVMLQINKYDDDDDDAELQQLLDK